MYEPGLDYFVDTSMEREAIWWWRGWMLPQTGLAATALVMHRRRQKQAAIEPSVLCTSAESCSAWSNKPILGVSCGKLQYSIAGAGPLQRRIPSLGAKVVPVSARLDIYIYCITTSIYI